MGLMCLRFFGNLKPRGKGGPDNGLRGVAGSDVCVGVHGPLVVREDGLQRAAPLPLPLLRQHQSHHAANCRKLPLCTLCLLPPRLLNPEEVLPRTPEWV